MEQKLSILLDEIESFNKYDKLTALLQLFNSTLNLMESTHYWTDSDLKRIKSRATEILQSLGSTEVIDGRPLYQNDELVRVYCFSQATYEYMRSRGLTPYVIGLKRD